MNLVMNHAFSYRKSTTAGGNKKLHLRFLKPPVNARSPTEIT